MVTKICPICKRRYKTVHPNQTHCHGEDCTKEGERLRKKRNTDRYRAKNRERLLDYQREYAKAHYVKHPRKVKEKVVPVKPKRKRAKADSKTVVSKPTPTVVKTVKVKPKRPAPSIKEQVKQFKNIKCDVEKVRTYLSLPPNERWSRRDEFKLNDKEKRLAEKLYMEYMTGW